MALKDFEDDLFFMQDGCLNVVVCIYNKLGTRKKTDDDEVQDRLNQTLEALQQKLKAELPDYDEIKIAYVYEAPLLTVRPFEVLGEDSPILYKRPCSQKGGNHDLAQVLFMGLALLEQSSADMEDVQNRLYLVTDERFERKYVNELVFQDKKAGTIRWNPRFSHLDVKAYLYKTAKGAGGGILEEIFEKEISEDEISED